MDLGYCFVPLGPIELDIYQNSLRIWLVNMTYFRLSYYIDRYENDTEYCPSSMREFWLWRWKVHEMDLLTDRWTINEQKIITYPIPFSLI